MFAKRGPVLLQDENQQNVTSVLRTQVAVVSCVCRLNTLDVPEPVSTGALHKAGSVSQLFGEQMRRGESVLQTFILS